MGVVLGGMILDGDPDPVWTPLLLNSVDMRVLIFGGGEVATRKARHFRKGKFTVVAESISSELKQMACDVMQRRIGDDEEDLMRDHDLVIVATDDTDLNRKLTDAAKEAGVRVNSVNGEGDVLIPSVLRRKGYTVSVSTEGSAPVYPPYLVRTIDGLLDERYDLMAELISLVRNEARERIPDQASRASLLVSILEDDDYWRMLGEGDSEGALEKGLRAVRG